MPELDFTDTELQALLIALAAGPPRPLPDRDWSEAWEGAQRKVRHELFGPKVEWAGGLTEEEMESITEEELQEWTEQWLTRWREKWGDRDDVAG